LSKGSTSRGRTAVIVGAQWATRQGQDCRRSYPHFFGSGALRRRPQRRHTVIITQEFILQLCPAAFCARVHQRHRQWSVIDPLAFLKEVASLRAAGVKVDGNLFVSNRAQVILPYHRMMELGSENAPGRVKIGTTSRASAHHTKTRWTPRIARRRPARHAIVAHAHRECVPREKHDCACAVQFRTARCDKMFREYADAAEQMRPFVRIRRSC